MHGHQCLSPSASHLASSPYLRWYQRVSLAEKGKGGESARVEDDWGEVGQGEVE